MNKYTVSDICFFDTETTGLIPKKAEYKTDFAQFPHLVQIAWIAGDNEAEHYIIKPDGWIIPDEAVAVHGITTEYANEHGLPLPEVMERFIVAAERCPLICAHNIYYDTSVSKADLLRYGLTDLYNRLEKAVYKGKRIDTLYKTSKFVGARNKKGGAKIPTLSELYGACFPGETFNAHDAHADIEALRCCIPVLVEKGIIELVQKEYPAEQMTFGTNPGFSGVYCENTPAERPTFVSREEGAKLREAKKQIVKR